MADASDRNYGSFTITRAEERDDEVRVSVKGELDLVTVPQLMVALRSAERSGRRSIVLDLEALTFMDVGSLRIILAAHGHAVEAGKSFSVESCRRSVARVFSLTGQDAMIDLHGPADRAAASARLVAGSPIGQLYG